MSGEIRTIDEYYKKYLPEYIKKYPIAMQVSQEEEKYLRRRRGECQSKKK